VPSGGRRRAPKVALATRSTVAALAKGVTSRLSGLRPGSKVTAQIRAGKKIVARAQARAGKSGRAKLKLKLARKQAKRLRHKRLTIRYVVRAADGSRHVVTKRLKMR
jgi:hypothetical protein